MAGLFADQREQQQLQVVRGQLASPRQAAVVGKAEAARTAAAAMVAARAAGAMPMMRRCEPGILVLVVMAVMMVMMVAVMGMVVWHDRVLYIVRYIVRYTAKLIMSTIVRAAALH
jgi:hypothetical protein